LRIPTQRLGRDRAHPVWRDAHLRRARETRRRIRKGARRGCRNRAQSDLGHRTVPSRRRVRREPHRLRRRCPAQGEAPRARRRARRIAHLRPQDLARLVALAAVWGASYLFMRYAVPQLGPVQMITLRVLVGGLLLCAFLAITRGPVDWRRHWKDFLFVGAIGTALPFVLIARALTSIDASTAAILNALSPLFTSLIAAAWIRDPLTLPKMAGIALCLVGTMVLVGWTPAPMTPAQLAGASMAVAATALYGLSNVYTKVRL